MARPRIKQFADDLEISYDKAKGLIEEGRRRKDGGTEVLESSMDKMRGFEAGGTLSRAAKKLSEREAELEEMARIATEDTDIDVNVDKGPKDDRRTYEPARDDYMAPPSDERIQEMLDLQKADNKRGRNKPRRKADGGTVYAESGKYMSCRGKGAAIRGTKFSGVY
tara:strand:- start:5 stop:502 length:498 start_codon:yes stop_codon:yes gene_type:complete